MKKALKKIVITSWKTTVAGIIVAVVTALVAGGKITPGVGSTIIGFAGSLGLVCSKDGDKSEFKAVQSSELQVALDALAVAKQTGNQTLINMTQAAVDALQNPPAVTV